MFVASTEPISSCNNRFEDLVDVPPKKFHAVNEKTFSTLEKGELAINIPECVYYQQLRRMEVLEPPKVGTPRFPMVVCTIRERHYLRARWC